MFALTLVGLSLLLIIPAIQRSKRERLHTLVADHLEPARLQISQAQEMAYEARSYTFLYYFHLDQTTHPTAQSPQEAMQRRIALWRAGTREASHIRYAGEMALRSWQTGTQKIDRWLRQYALASMRTGEPPVAEQADHLFEEGIASLRLAEQATSERQRRLRETMQSLSEAQLFMTTPLALICLLISSFAWWNLQRYYSISAQRIKLADQLQVAINELHHRVRNNLQVLGGLVDMRTYQAQTTACRKTLRGIAGHLQALAIVHDCVTGDAEFDTVQSRRLLQTLSERLQVNGRLLIHPDSASFPLSLGQAEALAMILSELLSAETAQGVTRLQVCLSRKTTTAEMVVDDARSDSEAGSSPPIDEDIEFSLIEALTHHDLRGKVETCDAPRTVIRIQFPLDGEK